MAPNLIQPWSSSSYGQQGSLWGKIESIDDPLRRNRIQVRVFGYQNDTGTIPKEKLEWIHVLQHNSQLAGAGSTHMYYPGAMVALSQIGTELMAMGAIPGFDSDKRNQGENKSGQSTQPDVPTNVQGEKKQLGTAADGDARDVTQLKREPQANTYLKQPDEKKTFDYSKGNAPYEKGDTSKFPDLKSIGIDKLVKGSDILSVIRQMDGNASGAIKAALDIIKNLRMNGFGTSKDVIGAGPIYSAANQFPSDFGAAPALNLLDIIRNLILASKIVKSMNPQNVLSLYSDRSLYFVDSSLRPQMLNVDDNIIIALQDAAININAASTPNVYPVLIGTYQTLFLSGLHQAVAAIIDQLNSLASVAGSAGGLINMFADQAKFVELAGDFAALATQIGIQMPVIASVGAGSIGAALNNQVAQASSQGSSGSDQKNQMISTLLNMFSGNPVALSELSSGQLNPQSLLKIPLKYAQKQINHPSKKFTG